MKSIVYILYVNVLLLSFYGCKKPITNNHTIIENNDINNTIAEYPEDNEPDRVIWQKPEMILDLLGDISNKTIADIGAGYGFFTFRLLPKAKEVIAADIDTTPLNTLKRLSLKLDTSYTNRLHIIVAKKEDPNLGNHKADVVFFSNTYMYIQNRISYLQTLKKYLNPSAQLLIVDYKKKNMPFGPSTQEKLDLSQVENELSQAGYDIIKSDDVSLDYQYIVLATLKS